MMKVRARLTIHSAAAWNEETKGPFRYSEANLINGFPLRKNLFKMLGSSTIVLAIVLPKNIPLED